MKKVFFIFIFLPFLSSPKLGCLAINEKDAETESEKIPDVPSSGSPVQVKEKPAARGILSFPSCPVLSDCLVVSAFVFFNCGCLLFFFIL